MTETTSRTITITRQPTEPERRARWLEARKVALTGTDAGKILTGKGLEVWLDKKGLSAPFNEAELPDFVRAGTYYERGTLAWYADRQQVPLRFADSYEFIRHPDPALPFGVTLDATREDDGCPVDAKLLHRWTPHDPESGTGWGSSGTELVPTLYAVQVLMQAIVLDRPRGHLATFFRVDGEFMHFTLAREAEREARLLAFLSGWWQRHIVDGEQPDAGSSEGARDFLAYLPRVGETVRKATPEENEVAEALSIARDVFKEAEAEKERLTNRMRQLVGTDAGLIGKTWKFTHKENAPSRVTDHEKVAALLLAKITELKGPEYAARIHGDILDRCTFQKQGSRVARFTNLKAPQE